MNGQKIKTGFSLTKDCIELLENNKGIDGSRSKNELVKNSIRFYIAYHTATRDVDFLSEKLAAASADAIKETENRMARIAYKIAVECAIINLLMIDWLQLDDEQVRGYRGKAVKILKETHGFLSLEQAKKFRAQEVLQGIAPIFDPVEDDYEE